MPGIYQYDVNMFEGATEIPFDILYGLTYEAQRRAERMEQLSRENEALAIEVQKEISKGNLILCECCQEIHISHESYALGGKETGIYKCKNSGYYMDKDGSVLLTGELCECEHCKVPFFRRNAKLKNSVDGGAEYTCPCCAKLLDTDGNVVDMKKYLKCNGCEIYFSKEKNVGSVTGLYNCPCCNQYLDEHGNIVSKSEVETCNNCDTDYHTTVHGSVCPCCTVPSVRPDVGYGICPTCMEGITDGDSELCDICGTIFA